MLIVLIEQSEPGMKLAADVLHPAHPDQVLLKRGFLLDANLLGKLRELGVLAIYVDYPDLGDLDRHLAPMLSPERLRVYGQVKATIAAVQKIATPTVGFADYYALMREFVITLFQQGQHPRYLEQITLRGGDAAVAHATAVAHLALLLGIQLQSYLIDQRSRLPAQHANEVVNLGIAGMLHDIGKCRISREAAGYSAICAPDDAAMQKQWEEHPRVGYEMIRGGVEPSAAVAVLHHHQRFDGKGFPALKDREGQPITLAGTSIHVFARILLAADLFDQLTHAPDESAGKAARRPAFQVLYRLRNDYAAWLDPMVAGALYQVVPPFPPGSRVRLSDGTDAAVTGLSARNPYAPIVRRFAGSGWTLLDQPVDLSQQGAPAIESADGIPVHDFVPREPACA